jgi:hypothetical protein
VRLRTWILLLEGEGSELLERSKYKERSSKLLLTCNKRVWRFTSEKPITFDIQRF